MTLFAGQRFEVAEQMLGRSKSGDIVVEAARPKSDLWRLELDPDVARSPIGVVAAFHFDEGAIAGTVLHVHHTYAPRLVEAIAHHDEAAVLALVAQKIINQKEN